MKPLEYETPEQPKIDKAALDIIKAPIADEVPLETPKATISQETIENMIRDSEPKPKRKKKVRLDDFDVPLSEKEEAMDRDEKIYYMRAQGFTLSTIAKKVGCSPQTVLNVINRRKQKEQQRLKSEAAYSDPEGGRKK
ncbi:MAG: helix-turn-helix domain-containing protein [Oscillospiraceae bacterium]|nr:helix-turn-helix domain-containing protein [Oscillospiraceae bacterium]